MGERISADLITDLSDFNTNVEVLSTRWTLLELAELAASLLAFAGQIDELHAAYADEELYTQFYTDVEFLIMEGPELG